MADSNITKRALSTALKELMDEQPFAKINVGDICERCDMNRKSFYYHFKDKYDLVNWIFDTEFISMVNKKPHDTIWDFFQELCVYLYSNRKFYRRAMEIKGQNSFSDHFREMMLPVITENLRKLFETQEVEEFYIHFFTDGVVSALERWIRDENCVPPEKFLSQVRVCVQAAALKVYHDMDEDEKK